MGKLRQRLFTTCATAIVMGSIAGLVPLDAQGGFLGNVTGTVGSPSIFRGGMDIIEVNNAETIVDWRPNDQVGTGAIDFLPNGNTVVYRTGVSSTLTDYTVLNRIQPVDGALQPVSRVIELNGTIQSEISGAPGGSVWFYTPGGFVVGATGVIDVGGLVLTSNPIDVTGGLYGANNTIRFRGIAGNTAGVTVNAGAQITASAANSYVALVAPRVVQGGGVTVDGSTAYVGAEQADLRINGGLFDIAVTVGTTDANGVTHSGTTTGPASANNPPLGTDNQRIFMVAVPKNNALTMLLSGDIGYPAAASVALENSAVVLSAGRDIVDGVIDMPSAATSDATASIAIGQGTWSSPIDASASGDITIGEAGLTRFVGNTTLTAIDEVNFVAAAGKTIEFQGNLSLIAGNGPNGGAVSVQALGGSAITVTGQLSIDASGNGNPGVPDAVGGTIAITADESTITTGSFAANATANASNDNIRSGSATGGDVSLTAINGATLALGIVGIGASGNSLFTPTPTVDGGSAQGGTIRIASANSTTTLADVQLFAQATSGTASSGTAGLATAGNIYIDLSGGTHNWDSLFGDVSTAAGYATNGGTMSGATPGVNGISIDVYNGADLTFSQSVSLYGDTSILGFGSGTPGPVRASSIVARARDAGSISVATDFFARSGVQSSLVNLGAPGTDNSAAGFGGSISVSAESGTFTAGSIVLTANAEGLDSANVSGNVTGGNIALFANSPGATRGSLSVTNCGVFSCNFAANGIGGAGVNGADGTGGTILFYASDADFSIPGLFTMATIGRAGGSLQSDNFLGTSGTGIGGAITIESRAGAQSTGIMTFGNFGAVSDGSATPLDEGDVFNEGDGGFGSGGTVAISLLGGQFTATDITLSAAGIGAAAAATCTVCGIGDTTPFVSGNGEGGTAGFTMSGGTANINQLAISATGSGGRAQSSTGFGSVGAVAGAGTGGTASFTAQNGTLTVGTLAISANGTGGDGSAVGFSDASSGNNGTGGTAQFVMDASSTANVTVNALTVEAAGQGGTGGNILLFSTGSNFRAGSGGSGTGGTADFQLAGGTLSATSIAINAGGVGGSGGENEGDGDGGNAGSGVGGAARFTFASEGHTLGNIAVNAGGTGGIAGAARRFVGVDINDDPIYAYGIGAGGNGGNGTGGTAAFDLDVDPIFANLTIDASGTGSIGGDGGIGGTGGNGFGGANGAGADLTVTFGTLTVSNQLSLLSEGRGGNGGIGYTGRGGDGGIGTGGEAGLTVAGPTALVQTTLLTVSGNGVGGNGGLGGVQGGDGIDGANGGAAFGGAVGVLVADNGTLELGGLTQISADATGGLGQIGTASTVAGNGGSGGAGGNATGGRARFVIENATVRDTGNTAVRISSIAVGGLGANGLNSGGAGGVGGNATGGLSQFESASGSIDLTNVVIAAGAQGGVGGNGPVGASGGFAIGGTASADWFDFVGTLAPSVSPVTAQVTMAALETDADAVGGSGGNGASGIGGAGGAATGGTASTGIGGSVTAQFAALGSHASATGGAGGSSGGAGTIGGAGGNALAGRTSFDASGTSNNILPASAAIAANAVGGAGGTGTAAGGAGGSGTGGNTGFSLNGAIIRATNPGVYALSALGTGGAGGSGGVSGGGGNGTGGIVQFSATNADFALPAITLDVSGTGGSGNTGGFAAGGVARLLNGDSGTLPTGARRSFASVAMRANGAALTAGGSASGTQGGGIVITDSSTATGGGLTIDGALSAEAFGANCACSGIAVNIDRNAMLVGSAALFTDSGLAFTFGQSGQLRAANGINAIANSAISVTQTSGASTQIAALQGTDITLRSVGNITASPLARFQATNGITIASSGGAITAPQLTAGTTIDVTANGAVSVGSATSGGALSLLSVTDTVSGGPVSGGSVGISSPLGLRNMRISSGSTTTLLADNGVIDISDLTSTGLISAAAQSVAISGGGALSFNGVTSTSGPIALTAGTLGATDVTSATTIGLTSTSGGVTAADLTGTSLAVTSAGNVDLNGPFAFAGPLTIAAVGTAAVNSGTVSASTIDIRSSDIVIGTGAQLGVRGSTTGIALTNGNNQRQTFIGGGSLTGAYSLSATEIGQMFADNISITGNRVSAVQSTAFGSSRAPDVSVRDFAVTAGATGNIASNGTFSILSTGKVRVQGAVRFTGLAPQGGLTIAAQEAVEVIAGSGLVDLQGSGGTPGGLLQMSSADVIVATLAAMDDVTRATTLDARNDRLAQNDGIIVQEGYLRAGAIRLAVSGGAYIQNSGSGSAFADRRGFTAGSLRIDAANANTQIILNGQLVSSATGAFVTGKDAIPLLSVNGVAGGQAGQYAARSTLNGCLIADPGSCDVVAPVTPVTPVAPTPDNRDVIDRILDPTVAVSQIFPVAIIQLRDFVAEGYPPLIDEPVTGVGNEDLWDSNCTVAGDESCPEPVAP